MYTYDCKGTIGLLEANDVSFCSAAYGYNAATLQSRAAVQECCKMTISFVATHTKMILYDYYMRKLGR